MYVPVKRVSQKNNKEKPLPPLSTMHTTADMHADMQKDGKTNIIPILSVSIVPLFCHNSCI